MELSIVIVSFNTRELLRECLNSIRGAGLQIYSRKSPQDKGAELEVWVVDNASSDSSPDLVEADFSWVNLIRSDTNVGFSKANNLALFHCRGRYVLFLNSDTILPKDGLADMLRYMDEHKDVGVLTCKLVLTDGSIDPDCHRGFPTPWASLTYFLGLEKLFPRSRLFGRYHAFYKPMDEIHETDACAGAFMLVRQEAFEEVGYWDEDFFFYGEDLDLCFRFKENGWKIIYYPLIEVTHYKGASSGIKKSSKHVTKATRYTKLKVKKASTEAMRLFYIKHYKDKYPSIVGFFVNVGIYILTKMRVLSVYMEGRFD